MYRSNNGFIRSLFLDGEGDASGAAAGAAGASTATPDTFSIQHGEQVLEFPRAVLKPILEKEIGDKYIPKASHNDQMARMRKELDSFKGFKSPDDLLADPEFKTKAVQSWGLDPKAANIQIQEQLARTRTELTEREVKPLQTKLGLAETRVKSLQLKDLRGQIAQAAGAVKVDDKFLKVPAKNGKPLIVSMMEDGFEYDEEHGEWFAKGTQGNKFAFSQSGDVPYMTVSEYFSVWSNGEGKDFLRSERQSGAESNPDRATVAGQNGKELRLTDAQMRDIPFFKMMQARAQKEGLTIVPV